MSPQALRRCSLCGKFHASYLVPELAPGKNRLCYTCWKNWQVTHPSAGDPPAPPPVELRGPCSGQGAACARVLRALPDWFGIPAAVQRYEEEIDSLPTWLASSRDELIGFLSVKRHNPRAAELYVMGILPAWQRRGAGRQLAVLAEAWLREEGVEYWQVKTLGPSHPDEGYAGTRAFYSALGFCPLEEFSQIWNAENPCLILVKRV
jgi:GNAT superfamily N-acetyltransferase